jgi:hypothetical protein
MQTTPLFYATIGTLPGISLRLGNTTLFFPAEQDLVLLVDAAHLHITARVPDLFVRFVRETIVERRLLALRKVQR